MPNSIDITNAIAYADGYINCSDLDASEDPGIGTLAISSGSVVSEVLAVSGTAFGVKATQQQVAFIDNAGVANGAGHAAMGFTRVALPEATYTIDTSNFRNDASDSFGPGGSVHVSTDGTGDERFNHAEIATPDTQRLVCGYWWKATNVANVTPMTGSGLFKGVRAGQVAGDGSDAAANYQATHTTFTIGVDDPRGATEAGTIYYSGNNPTDTVATPPGYSNFGGEITNNTQTVPILDNAWHFIEYYNLWNDDNVANGYMSTQLDGQLMLDIPGLTQLADKTGTGGTNDLGKRMNYVQPFPGFATNFAGDQLQVRISRLYVDTTLHQVFLGDNATLASCTGKYPLKITAWSDTSITAEVLTGVPTGWRYLYVRNGAGDVSGSFDLGAL